MRTWQYSLLLLAITITISATPLRAQETTGKPTPNAQPTTSGRPGLIVGTVADKDGQVLPGAQVTLDTGGISVTTNSQGEFTITNVAPGTHTLTVSYIGFAPFTQTVNVAAGQPARVNAVLQVASQNADIVVSGGGRSYGEVEAINEIRTSDTILNILPATVIQSLPNANVADAIGRLPGVTLERDEGEGKYVQIRGTEPRLSNLMIDNVIVPSPEGGIRQVKLDTIPADLIESVQIFKTLQANMEADAIGGSVNLVTKTAGELPTVSLYGAGGFTPIINTVPIGEFSGTVGQRFGAQKKIGVILSGSYDYNGRGINDIEPVPTILNGTTFTPGYSSMDIREYKYNRSRYGFGGSFDYKLGDASLIYVRGLFSEFLDFGKRWVYTLNDNTPPPGSAVPSSTTEQRQGNYLVSSLLVGGNHVMTKWWFTWGLSASRSRMKSPLAGGESITYFNYLPPGTDPVNNPPTSNCQYSPSLTKTVYRPQWSADCFAEAYNPANFQLAEIADSAHGKAAQLNLAGFGSAARSYHIGSHASVFEFGARIRNAHKFDDSYELDYFPIDPATAPRMDMFITGLKDPNYYGGSYKFGPVASWEAAQRYLMANLGAFSLTSTQGGNSNNFDLVERISAGYIMNTTDLGRFRLIAGLRIEGTNDKTVSFDQTAAIPCLCLKGGGSYVNPLPSASLQYRLDENSNVRFVYSRALSRPDPQTLTTSVSLDTSTTPFTYSVGNASLKPELANNYDLLYQRFLSHVGLLQFGTFYKSLYDPVVQILTHPTTGPYAGFQVNTPVNGGSGNIWGFEASFQQHFTYLPGLLKGLGVSANYSYATSKARSVNPDNRYENPPLLRQSPNQWNLSPTYDRGPLAIRLGLAYNGPFIFQYQYTDRLPDGTPNVPPGGLRGPSGDIYQYSHFQVDAQASYRIKGGFKFIAAAVNLNNEPWGFYIGSKQFVLQREYYKPTYSFGVRWDMEHGR